MDAPSRYVVAGNPVAHSQSPFIHAEFARQTGEPVSYDRLLCPLDAFAATVRGSGSKILDRRAVAIVVAAGPYGRFNPAMRRNADQLVITSRFRFTREDGLETTLSTQ